MVNALNDAKNLIKRERNLLMKFNKIFYRGIALSLLITLCLEPTITYASEVSEKNVVEEMTLEESTSLEEGDKIVIDETNFILNEEENILEENVSQVEEKTLVEETKEEANVTYFNTIQDLRNAENLEEGKVVATLGYHQANDGGGGEYTIVSGNFEDNGGTYIKLNNGKFAKLNINENDYVNILQFGGYNKGGKDNANNVKAFENILKAGYRKIYFPNGKYNFNQTFRCENGHVELKGESKEETQIVGFSLYTRDGVSTNKIYFNGSSKLGFKTNDCFGEHSNEKTYSTFVTEPSIVNGSRESNAFVEFKDTKFDNTAYVSVITNTVVDGSDNYKDEDRKNKYVKIQKDVADGCDFENIRAVAIFNIANSKESSYTNCTFKNIGKRDENGNGVYDSGRISAIWLGDVTNQVYTESDSTTINNCKFYDLWTKDDYSGKDHVINANFIVIRAHESFIRDNEISNVHGYGKDREAIYTKSLQTHITGNTITNGGYGEGYITCKGQKGKHLLSEISNNTITGEFGSGIYAYGPAWIKGNTISIKNCGSAIMNHSRNEGTSLHHKSVIGENTINCAPGNYLNDKVISSFEPQQAIGAYGKCCEIVVRGNKINISKNENDDTLKFKNPLIHIKCAQYPISITGNKFNSRDFTTNGFYIDGHHRVKDSNGNPDYDYPKNKDITITIKNNDFNVGGVAGYINLANENGKSSNRIYDIQGNIFYKPLDEVYNNGNYKDAIFINVSNPNDDTLIYRTKQTDRIFTQNHVRTTTKNIDTDNDFVTNAYGK